MDLQQHKARALEIANSAAVTEIEKTICSIARTLAAKIDIAIAEAAGGVQLTETQKMRAAVAPYVESKNGRMYLDGKSYAGDIPPSVMRAFYAKLMQQQAAAETGGGVEKKSLNPNLAPPVVAAPQLDNTGDIDAEIEAELAARDAEQTNLILRAQLVIKNAISPESIQKNKKAISNDTLIAIARAEELLADDEINLATPNGWGILSRLEIARRLFTYYKSIGNNEPTDAAI